MILEGKKTRHRHRMQREAPALFSYFRVREGEAKKSAGAQRKNDRKKSEIAERERKKREFMLIPPFAAPHCKTRF
jgi:hypothetical protein